MGMNAFAINMITQVLEKVPHRPVKLVSLGYPDILLPDSVLNLMFGEEVTQSLVVRPDAEKILSWHGMEGLVKRVPDSHDFFTRLGVDLSVTDFREVRGDELICDLNLPLPTELHNRFDLVFDGGTLEHCFNVAQAIMGMLGMAKVGGYIIHSNPFVLINHGFYNFSPTFYYDFYLQNGHKLSSQIVASKNFGVETKALPVHPTDRMKEDVPIESAISVIAQKCNANAPSFPVQHKYRESPELIG